MLVASILWGVATAALLWLYPSTNRFLVVLSIGYALLYVLFSLYRTFVPLEGVSLEQGKGPRVYIPKKGNKSGPVEDPPPG
jgi:phosphatidylcholine synthase